MVSCQTCFALCDMFLSNLELTVLELGRPHRRCLTVLGEGESSTSMATGERRGEELCRCRSINT